ncbi:MAG: sugar phosphate isomerase/epimerase [Thermotogae bacterium]|nr:sugar phosphate isomerase/epimerase [Thermotogota bacterium]
MKLAMVISTPDAGFDALAFKDDLKRSIEKLHALGFDGVEIAIRDPSKVNVGEIRSIIEKRNMDLVAIGTGQIYLQEGLNFLTEDEDLRIRTIERLKKHVDLAENFGAYVIIGLVRGHRKGIPKDRALELLLDGIGKLADYAREKKVKIVVEAINRYEVDTLNTLEETLKFLELLKRDNVGILADTFHMNIEEPVMEESLKKVGKKLFHVHIADSNRWAPGRGHIDFRSIIGTLREMGYDGYLSAEILPLPDPDTSAKETMEYMRQFIKG